MKWIELWKALARDEPFDLMALAGFDRQQAGSYQKRCVQIERITTGSRRRDSALL
ncbi:hypothetical protein [Stutzerimonas zhaodongensis]|jgi:hypothetical protein|uniref:Uncharacterized protein n=1 Tax=Stutzerimonas zhaodongensis TaxID=1176257 RepID=A0ABX8IYA4_9GAMM|nr:hypothetical protein [Stutzerimonas zhaodongensis]QWV17709.1 hypothetical protein KQ248_03150 [Stutzerimonas zhaodongensis]